MPIDRTLPLTLLVTWVAYAGAAAHNAAATHHYKTTKTASRCRRAHAAATHRHRCHRLPTTARSHGRWATPPCTQTARAPRRAVAHELATPFSRSRSAPP